MSATELDNGHSTQVQLTGRYCSQRWELRDTFPEFNTQREILCHIETSRILDLQKYFGQEKPWCIDGRDGEKDSEGKVDRKSYWLNDI